MKPTSKELPKASAGETFVVDTGWKAVGCGERGFKRGRDG